MNVFSNTVQRVVLFTSSQQVKKREVGNKFSCMVHISFESLCNILRGTNPILTWKKASTVSSKIHCRLQSI